MLERRRLGRKVAMVVLVVLVPGGIPMALGALVARYLWPARVPAVLVGEVRS